MRGSLEVRCSEPGLACGAQAAAPAPAAEPAACRLVAATVMKQGMACSSHHAEAAPGRRKDFWLGPGKACLTALTCAAGAAAGHVPILQRQDRGGGHGARALHRPHVCDARRGGAADLARGQYTATSLGADADFLPAWLINIPGSGCGAQSDLANGQAAAKGSGRARDLLVLKQGLRSLQSALSRKCAVHQPF